MTTTSDAATQLAVWRGGMIELGQAPTRLALGAVNDINVPAALAEAASRKFTLVLRGLATNRPPATGYLVFLNLPDGSVPAVEDPSFAGTISFFGVPPLMEGTDARAVSFEVSGVIERLRAAGRLGDGLTITVAPSGKLAPDSRPTINQIALFEF